MRADVVVVGGGVVGSSIAYHLRTDGFTGRVIVVERDPSYARASSGRAMGGIRQQFGSAVNVRLAQYSIDFYRRFDQALPRAAGLPPSGFVQRGYLFLVNDELADRFERRFARQRRLGACVERLSLDRIRQLVPDLRLDDIRFGLFGPEDGYASPRAVLAGLRHAALAAGATYLAAEVVGIEYAGGRVTGVTLDRGERVTCATLVNAAGPFAGALAALAGIALPVQPVRQQLFRCALARVWPYRFPVVIDPTGVHWRHEDPSETAPRDRIVVARTKLDEPPGENFDCDVSRWEREFRPPLISRLPALEPLELLDGWAGLYEMTPDHNPIIGDHPQRRGFVLANGFSGHGLMLAPAVGKAVSELVRLGACQTFDISAFDVRRFARGELFWDEAMI